MDWLTPQFAIHLLLAFGSIAATYGAIRVDLKNLHHRLDEERRLREAFEKATDESLGDIRDHQLTPLVAKVARIEGAMGIHHRGNGSS